MIKLISNLIFKKSFTPFAYRVCLRNETSHTQYSKAVTIRELKPNGLQIEIPINICQKGHNLTLFFLKINSDPLIKIPHSGSLKEAVYEAMVKVEIIEFDETNKSMAFVDLNFTQFDIVQWKKILEQYSKNQEQLNKMLTSQHKVRDEE